MVPPVRPDIPQADRLAAQRRDLWSTRRPQPFAEPSRDVFDLLGSKFSGRSDDLRQLRRPSDQDALVTKRLGEQAPLRGREAERRMDRGIQIAECLLDRGDLPREPGGQLGPVTVAPSEASTVTATEAGALPWFSTMAVNVPLRP